MSESKTRRAFRSQVIDSPLDKKAGIQRRVVIDYIPVTRVHPEGRIRALMAGKVPTGKLQQLEEIRSVARVTPCQLNGMPEK